jgi:hypothetical protein
MRNRILLAILLAFLIGALLAMHAAATPDDPWRDANTCETYGTCQL